MRKVKNTLGKPASKPVIKERTIKNPAKAGTLDPVEVIKVIKKKLPEEMASPLILKILISC